jgi:hypothetical protein
MFYRAVQPRLVGELEFRDSSPGDNPQFAERVMTSRCSRHQLLSGMFARVMIPAILQFATGLLMFL